MAIYLTSATGVASDGRPVFFDGIWLGTCFSPITWAISLRAIRKWCWAV